MGRIILQDSLGFLSVQQIRSSDTDLGALTCLQTPSRQGCELGKRVSDFVLKSVDVCIKG